MQTCLKQVNRHDARLWNADEDGRVSMQLALNYPGVHAEIVVVEDTKQEHEIRRALKLWSASSES